MVKNIPPTPGKKARKNSKMSELEKKIREPDEKAR